MKNKKGQFFILAAVILSAVVVSMAVTKNYVNINQEPTKFYELTSEMKHESLRVIDYDVYQDKDKLPSFIDMNIENWQNQDPNAEIVVIYGDEDEVTIENYGEDSVEVESQSLLGATSDTDNDVNLCRGYML